MKSKKMALGLLVSAAAGCYSAPALAQAEPFIGQLMLFGGNFCPRGWSTTNGQLLSIAQNTALFSILGTTYGGDGRVTFGLPDLRGRVPLSQGQGPGLSDYAEGQTAGAQTVTLTINNMPAHNHSVSVVTLLKVANGQTADTPDPLRNAFVKTGTTNTYYTGAPTANYMDSNTAQSTVTQSTVGGNIPFSIMQPYQVLQWCIALSGIFPSRN